MKNTLLALLVIPAIGLALDRCGNADNPAAAPGPDANLISNASFEKNGFPDLRGWMTGGADTAYVNFSPDVPPGGGICSVRLLNQWTFPGSISCSVAAPAGTYRYRLGAWGKVLKSAPFPRAGGALILSLKSMGAVAFRKSCPFADTLWTYRELLDTLATTATDTLVVTLRGNLDQLSSGYILFDLCRFENQEENAR